MHPMIQLIEVGQPPFQILASETAQFPNRLTPILESGDKLSVVSSALPVVHSNRLSEVGAVCDIDDNIIEFASAKWIPDSMSFRSHPMHCPRLFHIRPHFWIF